MRFPLLICGQLLVATIACANDRDPATGMLPPADPRPPTATPFSAALTTPAGLALGRVTCAPNPSIDTQGNCDADTRPSGWCLSNAVVDPGQPLPSARTAPGTTTPPPATCATLLTAGFTLPAFCTGQAYRLTYQVTATRPAQTPGGGQPPKEHDDKDRDKDDREKGDRKGGDDRKDRAGDDKSPSSRSAATTSTSPQKERNRGGERESDKDKGDKEKEKERDKDRDYPSGGQPGGNPAQVVLTVTVPFACPVPL